MYEKICGETQFGIKNEIGTRDALLSTKNLKQHSDYSLIIKRLSTL